MSFIDKIFGRKKKVLKSSFSQPTQQTRTTASDQSSSQQPHVRNSDNSPKTFQLSQLKNIDLGANYSMTPIDASIFDPSSKDLFMIHLLSSMDVHIQKYLPTLDFSSIESIQKTLMKIIMQTELGLCFAYAFRIGRGIAGMVFVNTPILNQAINFPHWTVDFFLFSPFRGQQFMPRILLGLFLFLKDVMHIGEIYATVDTNNTSCNKMIDNCLFFKKQPNLSFTDPSTGKKAIAYKCDISSLKTPF